MSEEQLMESTAALSAFSFFDSSRMSTFIISILLIVYGSFRSLTLDQHTKDSEKNDKDKPSVSTTTDCENRAAEVQTISSCQALWLPVCASGVLLVMFFFFESLQLIFSLVTAILATISFAFLLLPMCQYFIQSCAGDQKISFGVCGRHTAAEMMSFILSISIVFVWIFTGHWLLMDALGMGLCVAFIAFVRLPSLKVSTMLLLGLLIYDVFWVFFSSYVFGANVMLNVATRQADNPVGILASKLQIGGIMKDAPKLSLPAKLVFPSSQKSGSFNMLGLGDIVMPGLLLCFVLHYDTYKRSQVQLAQHGIPMPANYVQRVSYFHCSLIGYFLGLVTATVFTEVYRTAQPALLYLVPFTLLPLFTMAYVKGDLRSMWHDPFFPASPTKHMEV